jgi:hypothetical protein
MRGGRVSDAAKALTDLASYLLTSGAPTEFITLQLTTLIDTPELPLKLLIQLLSGRICGGVLLRNVSGAWLPVPRRGLGWSAHPLFAHCAFDETAPASARAIPDDRNTLTSTTRMEVLRQ